MPCGILTRTSIAALQAAGTIFAANPARWAGLSDCAPMALGRTVHHPGPGNTWVGQSKKWITYFGTCTVAFTCLRLVTMVKLMSTSSDHALHLDTWTEAQAPN